MLLATAITSTRWYEFSLWLTWVGLALLVLASVRAAIVSRRDRYGGRGPVREGWLERLDHDFQSRVDRNDHTAPPLRTPPGIS